MADPQIEDGYTKIANELLEQISRVNLSSYELRVLMAIIRKTYGFNKKEDYISLSQLAEITGIRDNNICRTLKKLKAKNMVVSNGHVQGIQKDYDKWVIQTDTIQTDTIQTDNKTIHLDNKVIQTDIKKLSKQIDTKEKKETIQKKDILSSAPYSEITKLYNSTCKSLPELKVLSDNRKNAIRLRWQKYGKKYGVEIFKELFERAEESDFLSGRSGKWTGCNFDWLLKEANLIKVMEGSYDNR